MVTNEEPITLVRSGIVGLAAHWLQYIAWVKRAKIPQYFNSVRSFYSGVLANTDIVEVERELENIRFNR